MGDWRDLSDDELRARLEQRGAAMSIDWLVANRDTEEAIAWVNFYLGGAE